MRLRWGFGQPAKRGGATLVAWRCVGQFGGIAATQLHCQRLLGRIVTQQLLVIAAQDCACCQHLGIEPRVGCQQAREIAEMPVGLLHHRCDA